MKKHVPLQTTQCQTSYEPTSTHLSSHLRTEDCRKSVIETFYMVFMFSIVSRLLRMCCESVHCGYCKRKSSPPGCLNMVQHFHLISAAIFSCNVTDEKSGPGPHWKVCKSGCYSPICPETLSLWPSLTSISPSSLPCDTKERTQNMERIVETRQKQIQRAEGDLSLLPRFESVFMYQFLDNI